MPSATPAQRSPSAAAARAPSRNGAGPDALDESEGGATEYLDFEEDRSSGVCTSGSEGGGSSCAGAAAAGFL
jgi:hypothetical protein